MLLCVYVSTHVCGTSGYPGSQARSCVWALYITCDVGVFVFTGGSVGLVGEPPPLPPLTMATKAESVASVTSQCSFSSTIVHVGDKKPPESGGHHQHSPRSGFFH